MAMQLEFPVNDFLQTSYRGVTVRYRWPVSPASEEVVALMARRMFQIDPYPLKIMESTCSSIIFEGKTPRRAALFFFSD
jgi:hypothetical protein